MAAGAGLPRLLGPADMIVFRMDGVGPSVEMADTVLDHLSRHRQTTCWKREAGGQLFAGFDGERWVVEKATGPRRSDLRSRFGFRPDRRAEQREIDQAFALGLHFIGDWHTHPEPVPKPSVDDLESVAEMVRESSHELPGFVMVIVGQQAPPNGLWVSLHYPDGRYGRLLPVL